MPINPKDVIWDSPAINPKEVVWDDQMLQQSQPQYQQPTMDALGTPGMVDAAGGMVGTALDVPFIPLHMASNMVAKQAEKLGGPFSYRPDISLGDLVKRGFGQPETGEQAPSTSDMLAGSAEMMLTPTYMKGVDKVLSGSWIKSKSFQPIQEGFINKYGKAALEKDLPIPASAINPTKPNLELAQTARENAPSNQVVREAHNKLQAGSDNMWKEFKTRWGLFEDHKGRTSAAFDRWAEHMGGPKEVLDLPETTAFIKEKLNDPLSINNDFWQTQAKSFIQNPTVQGTRDMWAGLDIKKKTTRGVDKTARMELADVLDNELRTNFGDTAATLLSTAKDYSRQMKQANALKTLSYKSLKDGQFSPGAFAAAYEAKRNTPNMFMNFTKEELANMDEFAGIMELVGGELNQKISSATIADTLTKPTKLNKFLYYLGMPQFAKYVPNPGIVKALHAGKLFQPGSKLYQNAIGEASSRGNLLPDLPVNNILPGISIVGGRIMLNNKTKDETK